MSNQAPDFITSINDDFRSQVSHVFLLHGNIYDYCDNSGKDLTIKQVMGANYDDNLIKDAKAAELEAAELDRKKPGLQDKEQTQKVVRILATYNMSQGLDFPHPKSFETIQAMFKDKIGDKATDGFMRPLSPQKLGEFMNMWFTISKERIKMNRLESEQGKAQKPELLVTWLIEDADTIFPNGEIAQIGPDRVPIVSVRQWARDEWIGHRNRIILSTRFSSDLHSSVRELCSLHNVRKPNFDDRLSFINGFDALTQKRAKAAGGKIMIAANNSVSSINWADDFDANQCAIQSAGMSRKQLKDVFLKSWINQQPVDFSIILQRKQRALEEEYQGILDFKEPTFGFDEIGGHDHFKRYCNERIIVPLRTRDTKTCSRGVLMTGPPGTGKSMLALALAKEAKMNFMQVDLGKVFAGLVGETEKNMRKLLEAIEAAAPCIVFVDEVDSVLSAGRSSSGDSGTSGRVFNSFMTFLSDPSRVGRVVVLMASNRPDMLDAALIREGRMDAKVPILPPAKGDAKGRTAILKALGLKHKVTFDKKLAGTLKDPKNGLGRLLTDSKRIWTGAEIESLVRKSMATAAYADRKTEDGKKDYTMFEEDWNHAMNVIVPSTGQVETQIRLALRYVNDFDYCPQDYWEQAKEEQENAAREETQRLAQAA